MLQAHNEKRALHQNTGSVSTNMVITSVAQAYADYLAQNTKFEHSSGSGYGENLAKSWSSDDLGTLADCGSMTFSIFWSSTLIHINYTLFLYLL